MRGDVTWADAFVHLAAVALDALDPAGRRGEARGERAQVIVHLDGRSDGDGSARIHLGPVAPPQFGAPPVFAPPTGERLEARWFTWN